MQCVIFNSGPETRTAITGIIRDLKTLQARTVSWVLVLCPCRVPEFTPRWCLRKTRSLWKTQPACASTQPVSSTTSTMSSYLVQGKDAHTERGTGRKRGRCANVPFLASKSWTMKADLGEGCTGVLDILLKLFWSLRSFQNKMWHI